MSVAEIYVNIKTSYSFILTNIHLGQGGGDMYLDKYKIRETMTEKGITTQTELAGKLGITKNQLSVLLSKKFNPIKSNVMLLCDYLGVSPLSIISEEIPEGYQTHIFDLLNNETTEEKYYFPKHSAQTKNINQKKKKPLNTNLEHGYPVRVLELFAGGGGLACGLEKAGLDSVALVEIDKKCCDTLRKNRPSWNVINADIHNVNFSQFDVDVVTGGFPCQAFSYAGKKLGFEDTRGTLFHEFARCLKETRPLLFMAENVRGLISHDHGRTLTTILGVFAELGYKVQHKLLNAVNYSIPQKRERIVIVGTLAEVDFEYPETEEAVKTIRDALAEVPPSEGMQYSENKKRVLQFVPPGGCWRHLPKDIQKAYMGKSYFSSGGRTGMARRLSWDEPSLTLTCSPTQKQTERCHPEETRPFTVREYARIQTFPDDWNFAGTISDKYRQIGNAVPVELGYKLGVQIVQAISAFKHRIESPEKGNSG